MYFCNHPYSKLTCFIFWCKKMTFDYDYWMLWGINLSNNIKEYGGGVSSGGRGGGTSIRKSKKNNSNYISFMHSIWYTIYCLKNFGHAGNREAHQALSSTRPLGITRSVPGLCGYQAKDYLNICIVKWHLSRQFFMLVLMMCSFLLYNLDFI